MAEQWKRRSGASESAVPQTHVTTTQPSAEDTIDLVELMYRLLGRWKLIVCLALICAVAAGAYTSYFMTPMYQATSTIYVVSRSDSAINMADLQFGSALTSDYIKVFKMWEVHEEVISNLDLPYSYGQMRSMLSVVNESGTRMLDITFTSPSAEEAATVANEYAKVASQYIADTMATNKPSIMSVALVPSNPVSPNRTKNIMMGFILGALLACGIVVLQTLLDDKYKTAEDIRRYTGLATLAVVPIEGAAPGRGKKGTKKGGRKA